MACPETETCAPRPAEEPEHDSLFERWLARFPRSHQRLRAAPAPSSAPSQPPIGDEIADAWFR